MSRLEKEYSFQGRNLKVFLFHVTPGQKNCSLLLLILSPISNFVSHIQVYSYSHSPLSCCFHYITNHQVTAFCDTGNTTDWNTFGSIWKYFGVCSGLLQAKQTWTILIHKTHCFQKCRWEEFRKLEIPPWLSCLLSLLSP